jgi:lipoate-protein ligase A
MAAHRTLGFVELWRFIDAGAAEAPVMFGRMPVIAAQVAQGAPNVLMTSVFDTGHFQIGWFDDVDAVIDLEAARAAGVQVFRRPVFGGGCAFYDTRAAANFSWIVHDDDFATLDEALEFRRPLIRRALDALALGDAHFEGSSDIRWKGRKLGTLIAQSVLGTKITGGFLNLKRPDLELYARIARVPEEKFKDKIIKDAVEYICTPGDIRGSELTYEELRDAVVNESRASGLELDAQPITSQEDANVAGFVGTVSDETWIKRISSRKFRAEAPHGARVGFANFKAKKLVRAGVAIDHDGVIARVMMAGDMHVSPPDAMDKVAAALEGARAHDSADVRGRIAAAFEGVEQADAAAGITPDDCADAVALAVKNSEQ